LEVRHAHLYLENNTLKETYGFGRADFRNNTSENISFRTSADARKNVLSVQ
jgi:hypothetical protein